eukprot:5797397-Heterocapsa_arctica.AAC.1
MEQPPATEFRDALFLNQVKTCAKMKTEYDNYYKAEKGSEVKCVDYLYNCAMQVVERERFEVRLDLGGNSSR